MVISSILAETRSFQLENVFVNKLTFTELIPGSVNNILYMHFQLGIMGKQLTMVEL